MSTTQTNPTANKRILQRQFSIDSRQNSINAYSLPTVQSQPASTTTNNSSADEGVHLRAKLRFFLMSPCWKWHLKGQRPWKAWFQFLKIIIITTQLILFGIDRQTHVIFISETNITFHHLFVQNWDSSQETLPYPQAMGDFAVYDRDSFLSSINYAVTQFHNLTHFSLGLFGYRDPRFRQFSDPDNPLNGATIRLCMNRFENCHWNAADHTYNISIDIQDTCFEFNATDNFDVEDYLLTKHNETIDICRLNVLTVQFSLHAIQLKNQKPFDSPDCYHFLITLTSDNNARTGKIRQRLDSEGTFRSCRGNIHDQHSHWTLVRRDLLLVFDYIVIVITIISFILCIRSLWKGHRLCQDVRRYYARARKQEVPLKWTELQVFYSFWYFIMIITDCLLFSASIIKLQILYKISDNYNGAGLLLGLSNLFAWISILRYLSFFRKYNILFLTIQKAIPMLIRFVLVVVTIYCGFMFCGWLVLGPYHTKFETVSSTYETLFSLINGDDMYATFANIETESMYIWLFSQAYLISFISLFIYVVLSLFIALIIDGYETVKKYHINGYPKSRLQKFCEENIPQWSGPEDWQDLTRAIEPQSICFPCCFKTSPEVQAMVRRDTYLSRNSSQFH